MKDCHPDMKLIGILNVKAKIGMTASFGLSHFSRTGRTVFLAFAFMTCIMELATDVRRTADR